MRLRYPQEFKRPCPAGFRAVRVHDLKHTFGHRLRAVGVSFEDRKVLLGHKTFDVTTHYSAAEIGILIAATERVCELTEQESPAVTVVRSHQAEGAIQCQPPADRSIKEVATADGGDSPSAFQGAFQGSNSSSLPKSLQEAAAELAKDNGVSLDQFIAAAVADKVGTLHAAIGSLPDSPYVAAVRRPGRFGTDGATIKRLPSQASEEVDGDLANGWNGTRYWRRATVPQPNLRRAAIVKKRSAKFPYRLP